LEYENDSAELGLGHRKNKILPTKLGIKASTISCCETHSIVVDVNNDIWVWGANNAGQLGLGKTVKTQNKPVQLVGFKAIDASCETQYTKFIDMNHQVWGCGTNAEHQLGLEDTKHKQYIPVKLGIKAKKLRCTTDETIYIDMNDNIVIFGLEEKNVYTHTTFKAMRIVADRIFLAPIN
jgi:alpha-tubulin suppressor-like RCC1 family protein